jgi:hypothetical protein
MSTCAVLRAEPGVEGAGSTVGETRRQLLLTNFVMLYELGKGKEGGGDVLLVGS